MICKASKEHQENMIKEMNLNEHEVRFLTVMESLKDFFFGMHPDDQENTTVQLSYYDLFLPSAGEGYSKLENFLDDFMDWITEEADSNYLSSLHKMKEYIEKEIKEEN